MSAYASLLKLLLPEQRHEAFLALQNAGLMDSATIDAWLGELAKTEYAPLDKPGILATLKIQLDQMVVARGGEVTSKKTHQIVRPAYGLLELLGRADLWSVGNIRTLRVLDFGAGTYSPLAVSMVLFANGFEQAVAFEPFPVDVDFAVASLGQTLQALHFSPAEFAFSGISPQALKSRLALLELDDVAAKLTALNRGEIDCVDLGGVQLTNRLQHVGQLDFVMSNSVLEHVQDLLADMRELRSHLKEGAMCLHTVDFSDHRAIGIDMNLYQMYYDNVLEGINGLRPAELEYILSQSGFVGTKVNRLNAPESMLPQRSCLVPRYAGFSDEQLSQWVNSYLLEAV